MGNLRNCKTPTKRTPSTKGAAKKRIRKPKKTKSPLTDNDVKKETSVPINESTDTGHNHQTENSDEHYKNFFRLLQLFPHFHPAAIEGIFLRCDRDLLRAIDNLLRVKQYAYVLHGQANRPATSTPFPGQHPQHNDAANNFSRCPNYRIRLTELFHGNVDNYVPNGTMTGIREQISTYEREFFDANMQ